LNVRTSEQHETALKFRMNKRRFLQYAGATMLGAAVMGIGCLAYATQIEPDWVVVERVNLTLSRLNPAFDNFRLVQISDIHLSERLTGEQLALVVQKIINLQPDMVAITGDFVDRVSSLTHSLADLHEALTPLAAETQVVAVLGNHDYWTGASDVRDMLSKTGIMELPNQVLTLERAGAHLFVGGVDDVWEGHNRLSRVLQQIGDQQGAAILLVHEPDFADTSRATGRFDLQISGHSHGGQVVLPWIGPPILPRYAEKYPLGLYTLGSMFQYTNRGLGTIPPRVRFNCRPEVTLFTLKSGTSE
jgi:hypothetical protein